MFRKTTIALLLIATVAGMFVTGSSAEARTLNDIRRAQAEGAHAYAARTTREASAIHTRLPAEQAKFNVAMSNKNYNVRFYGKQAFIRYLNQLKRSLAVADRAHAAAIPAWERYWITSKNGVAKARQNQLAAARAGFATTIGQIDARITYAAARR